MSVCFKSIAVFAVAVFTTGVCDLAFAGGFCFKDRDSVGSNRSSYIENVRVDEPFFLDSGRSTLVVERSAPTVYLSGRSSFLRTVSLRDSAVDRSDLSVSETVRAVQKLRAAGIELPTTASGFSNPDTGETPSTEESDSCKAIGQLTTQLKDTSAKLAALTEQIAKLNEQAAPPAPQPTSELSLERVAEVIEQQYQQHAERSQQLDEFIERIGNLKK
ncbi:hypothetical protein Pan189_07190 [Stratiformator vulcanicus]|uniref:Chromosome partition protein Smc n=2 Tax=Stratiformator vulcanicus TaxID=2527980 RepID=A0A517QXN8_9PLAN|nr:hypothetical protein Pan189_07190 [Stratiformator vulcanicus]